MKLNCTAEFGTATSVTDAAMANSFAIDNPDAFRYSPALGWFRWTGKVWNQLGGDELVMEALKTYNRKALQLATGGATPAPADVYKALVRYQNAGPISNQMRLLRGTSPVHVEDVSAFDADPDLLNTQSGVVDLRTGELSDHDPGLLMTKVTRAGYNPRAEHDDWKAALTALDPMDDETRYWLRRLLGSGCSGRTPTDDLSALFQGGGANGKSTVLTACRAALGTYAGIVADDVLRATDSHPTGLTDLRGLRLALVEETPDGMKLNVQIIKKLSSGQPIRAHKMRQDNFEFMPSHTLVVATNFRPAVRETDKGTWRRLALVPFTKTYGTGAGETPVNRHLRGELESGSTGADEAILAWLVMGAREWYSVGSLTPLPAQVQAATDDWREESDGLRAFISEAMEFGAGHSVPLASVWSAFQDWQEDTSMASFRSQRTFNKALSEHDVFVSARCSKQKVGAGSSWHWVGVRLKPTVATASIDELTAAARALAERKDQ